MQIKIINDSSAADALSAALAAYAEGDVPLIVDSRAPIADDVLQHELPAAAAWAALTSGTTGAPKIVVRSAASWQIAFEPLNAELGLCSGDGLWMPVHQVSSMALFSAAWAQSSGLDLVIPKAEDPGLSRAVVAHVTPSWLERLLEMLDIGQNSTLHTVLVGGDRLPEDLMHRAQIAGLRVVTYVGAAELSLVAWDRGDGMRAFEGVATRIVDNQLWVSSPQIALDVIGGNLEREVVDGVEWATVGDRVAEQNGGLEFLGRGDGAVLTAGATV
ncbi:MAG: AMP-binding protein, partial [Yaniella sp.]|nr:AMP-binding protein [Yaniella sp.]